MKVLVTGSAGFIGYHVTKALLDRGDAVIGLDDFNGSYDPKLKAARHQQLQARGDYELRPIDVTPEVLFIPDDVSAVVHFAAQAGVQRGAEHGYESVNANVLGFYNILDGCRTGRVPKVVYASSSAVYGNSEKFFLSERDRTDDPISLYAATKKSNELMAYAYSHVYDIQTIGLRFFTVYGPWGNPDMAMWKWTDAILNDELVDVYNFGDMERDFVHVSDACQAVLAAVDLDAKCEVINVGSGKPKSIGHIISLIGEAAGKAPRLNKQPMQDSYPKRTCAAIQKAQRLLNYEPKVGMLEGIKEFVEWFKEYKA